MPKEIEKLLDIARIRNACRAKNIIKVAKKSDKVIFYFDEKTFDFSVVEKLLKKYGMRIKFSPAKNPYVTYNNGYGSCAHGNAQQYLDRSSGLPHVITHDDICYQIFTQLGFTWGGDWGNPKDFQHFEKSAN